MKNAAPEEVDALVARTIVEVAREAQLPLGELSPSADLLGTTGLDSLALAEVVIRLQDETGVDPFRDGFILFRTIGELSRLFFAALTDSR